MKVPGGCQPVVLDEPLAHLIAPAATSTPPLTRQPLTGKDSGITQTKTRFPYGSGVSATATLPGLMLVRGALN